MRHSAAGVGIAAVVAFGTTWALTGLDVEPEATPVVAAAPGIALPAAAPTPAADSAPPVSNLSEEGQRLELPQRLAEVPGIDRVVWSTASTLQVFINDPTLATDAAICQVMTHYPLVRASRLQLQLPPDSDRPVRFKQCSVF